jgi:hypothetical protein
MAYNDLRSFQDIKPITNLNNISVLSIFGNPFLSSLSYLSFVKMIIPTLIIIDDKDVNAITDISIYGSIDNSIVTPQD